MARKVVEHIISDLSGEEMQPGKGETIEFSYRNTNYRLDVTDKEAATFDKAMAHYIEAAQTVAAPASGTRRRSTGTRAPSGSGRSKEELAAAREWLRANGHEVSDRGRIRSELLDLYDASAK